MPVEVNNLKIFSLRPRRREHRSDYASAFLFALLKSSLITALQLFLYATPVTLQAAITFSDARTRAPIASMSQTGSETRNDSRNDGGHNTLNQTRLLEPDQQLLLLLDATAKIELNPSIESGLNSGVPLYFNATIEINKARRWWPDATLHKQVRRFSLVYYELTRHYRVSWLDESRSRNFRSLLDALESIGTLRSLPLQLDEALQPGQTYRARVNLALDQNALPLALRPVAFVNSSWRLESEEYRWQIN